MSAALRLVIDNTATIPPRPYGHRSLTSLELVASTAFARVARSIGNTAAEKAELHALLQEPVESWLPESLCRRLESMPDPWG